MKKLAILALISLGFLSLSAQEVENNYNNEFQTIFSKDRSNGGYGALMFNYTQINGKDAFLMGARGAWVVDHSFAVGFGGTGFVNDVDYHRWVNDEFTTGIAGGYGGLYLEPIIAPRFPVHLSFPVLLGAGGVSNVIYNYDWDDRFYDDRNSDVFFVVEPVVELEFNLTRHMRMAASVSYRWTSKISIQDLSPDVMEGWSAGLVMKFGKF
jgi:hypothetical protein